MKKLLSICVLFLSILLAQAGASGPWDMSMLSKEPQATWGTTNGQIREVYYEGESFTGKPTRVFGYYGKPDGSGPFPGIILVHGGGGTAFPEWVKHWVANGYAALAMDLAGHKPAGRLPDGGPEQSDDVKFRAFTKDQVRDMWTYQAVAAVIRGHSLLLSRKEVDPERTAITGISWGGYLTCIVVGLDHRFKAAVPVYGCGFINENSAWVSRRFAPMSADVRQRWVENFEPSRYLDQAQCPMLFVSGTCDFAYPLDSYQKSYSLVKTPVSLSIAINRPHGHIWTFPEVDTFINSHLTKGDPLLVISTLKIAEGTASAEVSGKGTVATAELNYTTDSGAWQKRVWKILPAEIKGNTVSVKLPVERPLVCYLRIIDQRGLAVNNPHVELK